MTVPTGPKRQGWTLLLILVIAMILDKFLISRFWPEASGLISINPMLVFLDIPLDLSLTFGLLSVTGLFIGLCLILILPNLWKIITGVLAIPFCVLSGGLIYDLSRDELPKQARNAIESFGINADIYTSIPGHELIHLKGSMVMLGCLFIGMHICVRRIRESAPDAGRVLHPEFIADRG
jgi:hypothetical protein